MDAQQEIGQLKYTIQRFKEYDEKRKKYYADAMVRLGALEMFVKELDDAHGNSLGSRITDLMVENKRLRKIIEVNKYIYELSDSEEEYGVLLLKHEKLKEDCKNLKNKCHSAEVVRDRALSQVGELLRELNDYKLKEQCNE